MPSDYTPKGAATRLVGYGELNFTDQILLANRVGLEIRQRYRQTYCEMEHNCYDGLISCFEGPLGGGGGREVVCTVYTAHVE